MAMSRIKDADSMQNSKYLLLAAHKYRYHWVIYYPAHVEVRETSSISGVLEW